MINAVLRKISQNDLCFDDIEDATEYTTDANGNVRFEGLEDGTITCYRQGDFVDLCRGPHVENTKFLRGFAYKLNRVIPPDEEDKHHIISRKEKVRFKVNNPENIIKIKRRTHVALNNLFENNQEPKKQLQMMFDIWKSALST